jgi:hypothetical protein
MTRSIAAYDTEMSSVSKPRPDVPSCLEACRRIGEVHRRHLIPATFFIVGRVLKDHPLCGPAPAPDEIREEIQRGVESVERFFIDRALAEGSGHVSLVWHPGEPRALRSRDAHAGAGPRALHLRRLGRAAAGLSDCTGAEGIL